MLNIKRKRIYRRVGEGEVADAIISFMSIPHPHVASGDFRMRVGDITAPLTVQKIKTVFWRALRIDLWLFQIEIKWTASEFKMDDVGIRSSAYTHLVADFMTSFFRKIAYFIRKKQ